MTTVPGAILLPQLRDRDIARDLDLRKDSVIVIEIAIGIGVVMVPNLPGIMVVARAAVTTDVDRDRLLGNGADLVRVREDRGPNQEAKPVPVIIAGIDRLR